MRLESNDFSLETYFTESYRVAERTSEVAEFVDFTPNQA